MEKKYENTIFMQKTARFDLTNGLFVYKITKQKKILHLSANAGKERNHL